jgi:hypothetical protein
MKLQEVDALKQRLDAIVLPVQRRLEYYEALDAAYMDGNTAPFVALVTDCMREAFARYWFVLGVA